MLAGEEERSCWQTQEESKNRAACKGCVYYTVYTWRKTPGEQTWSKRSCCHVDNTQTHSEKSGRTWSLLCQAVVTSDPLALQLEMMPARQLNVGQAKQTVCLNVFISVSVFVCTQGCGPAVTNHSRVKMYAPMIAKFHKVGKGLMFAHFAPCQCSFSVYHHIADVSPCVWLLLCRLRITEEEERSLHGHGKADRLWTCALERQDSGTKLPSYQVWFTVHALLPHKETRACSKRNSVALGNVHTFLHKHTHIHKLSRHSLSIVQPGQGRWWEGWGVKGEVMWGSWSQAQQTGWSWPSSHYHQQAFCEFIFGCNLWWSAMSKDKISCYVFSCTRKKKKLLLSAWGQIYNNKHYKTTKYIF